jgi:hypothetical protein
MRSSREWRRDLRCARYFWLAKLEQFGGGYHRAEMVRAFVSSVEYRACFATPAP